MNNNNFELDRRSDDAQHGPRTKPRFSDENVTLLSSDDSEENRLSREYETVGGCDVDASSGDSMKSGQGRVSEPNLKLEDEKSKGHIENLKSESPMPSISDDSEGSRTSGAMAVVGPSRQLGYGFEVGDMVWGKVKSHPWWPGQIFSESFATNSVRRSKRDGHVLVAFFGDSSYGWFELAELIPFAPNFAEKSRQTNSRTFVKAVEEAVDEVSRRCYLSLACRCRDPFNFCPTDVKGYYAANVGDTNNNEGGWIYSSKQIKEARDNFRPKSVLDFIKQLAVTPKTNEHLDINLIKNKATAFAYRKAVFEEFDETYAQAFGYQPVKPSRESTEDPAQRLKVASRAPLSGPMVIAEALGKNKTSSKSSKSKFDQSKKDKYLLKRREDLNEDSSSNTVILKGSSENLAGEFVLQKRPSKPKSPKKGLSSGDNSNIIEQSDHSQSQTPAVIRKAKVCKRPIGDQDESALPKKKKKKEKDLTELVPLKKKKKEKNLTESDTTVSAPAKKSVKEDSSGYNKLDLQHVLNDLQALAVNHSHAEKKHENHEVIRQILLRFRSLVYQKSASVFPAADDDESNDSPRLLKYPAVTKESNPKLPKPPPVRSDDTMKNGRKRGPSDRQDEKVLKKKKFRDAKQLAAEKRDIGGSSQAKVKGEFTRKSQPNPKVADDPTMLILKIPPGGNLPSGNELKARFARFGPLDHSGTKVFWKSSTCRVIYRHKIHAEAAYKFATGNNLFGNTNITCYLRDAGAPEAEPAKIQKEDSPVRATPPLRPAAVPVPTAGLQLKSCLKKAGGDDVVAVSSSVSKLAAPRVKFRLGGEDDGGSSNQKNKFNNADGGSSSSSTVMEYNSKNFQKVVPASLFPNTQKNNVPPPLLPPLLPTPNTQYGPTDRPPLPPSPLLPPLLPTPNTQYTTSNRPPAAQQPPAVFHNAQYNRSMPPPPPPPIPVLPPVTQIMRAEMAPNPEYRSNDENMNASSSGTKTEFGEKMMSLMRKCNEVVSDVKDMLGYMPYHPL
jgi:DNA (cytosine-5)-methyltransferase 3A